MIPAMASRREFIRLSVRGVLCTTVASAGLSACAAVLAPNGCQYLTSVQSARPRSVGGGTMICDSDLVDSAGRIPHADDYVLENEMW